MSDWEDTYDIGGDGVPDDFDSVADFDDGTGAATAGDLGSFDAGAQLADVDAWIVDLDLGGLLDLADIAVVAGVDDVAAEGGGATGDGAATPGAPLFAPLLAHDLSHVPDGADPFAGLAGRRLDDDELRNELRHLRVRSPFAPGDRDSDSETAGR